jgi:hypothetical protein
MTRAAIASRYGYRDVAIELRRTANSVVRAKPRRKADDDDDGYRYPVAAPEDKF